VAPGICANLCRLLASDELPGLYIDLRDWDGKHIAHLPGRLVELRVDEESERPTLEVRIAAIVRTDRQRPQLIEPSRAPLAQVALQVRRGKRDGSRRLTRTEIEGRNEQIRLMARSGLPVVVIARAYQLSEQRIREVIATCETEGAARDGQAE